MLTTGKHRESTFFGARRQHPGPRSSALIRASPRLRERVGSPSGSVPRRGREPPRGGSRRQGSRRRPTGPGPRGTRPGSPSPRARRVRDGQESPSGQLPEAPLDRRPPRLRPRRGAGAGIRGRARRPTRGARARPWGPSGRLGRDEVRSHVERPVEKARGPLGGDRQGLQRPIRVRPGESPTAAPRAGRPLAGLEPAGVAAVQAGPRGAAGRAPSPARSRPSAGTERSRPARRLASDAVSRPDPKRAAVRPDGPASSLRRRLATTATVRAPSAGARPGR